MKSFAFYRWRYFCNVTIVIIIMKTLLYGLLILGKHFSRKLMKLLRIRVVYKYLQMNWNNFPLDKTKVTNSFSTLFINQINNVSSIEHVLNANYIYKSIKKNIAISFHIKCHSIISLSIKKNTTTLYLMQLT